MKDEAGEGFDRLVAVKQLRPGGDQDERTVIAVVRSWMNHPILTKLTRALPSEAGSRTAALEHLVPQTHPCSHRFLFQRRARRCLANFTLRVAREYP